MFGSIVVAGIKILLSVELDRRALIIISTSLAIGLGVTYTPDILNNLPPVIKNVFSSGISAGGLTAIVLNLLLPRESVERETEAVPEAELAPESAVSYPDSRSD
jgi:xanthine permease XanP